MPSIFTRRNGRIVQTKPIRYEKTFPSSGHRCRHLGSIRRRISSEQPLFEAERYGTRGYGHEAQLRVDLVQPRRRLVSGHPIRHLGRHHRHRFEGHLYVAPRLYGQDQAAALHLGQQHCDPALRLFQLQTPRLDVGRPGFQYAVRLLDGLGRQLAGGATRPVDQPPGLQSPADRLVQTLRAPLHRRRSDDDLGQVRPFALAAAYRRRQSAEQSAHGRIANAQPANARPLRNGRGQKPDIAGARRQSQNGRRSKPRCDVGHQRTVVTGLYLPFETQNEGGFGFDRPV